MRKSIRIAFMLVAAVSLLGASRVALAADYHYFVDSVLKCRTNNSSYAVLSSDYSYLQMLNYGTAACPVDVREDEGATPYYNAKHAYGFYVYTYTTHATTDIQAKACARDYSGLGNVYCTGPHYTNSTGNGYIAITDIPGSWSGDGKDQMPIWVHITGNYSSSYVYGYDPIFYY